MTTRPYELLVRFDASGKVAGVSVRTITTVNGRDYESDPQSLSGVDDPAFTVFADQFSAAVVAERDQIQATLLATETERDGNAATVTELQSQVDTIPGLLSQIAAMTAEVERLTALIPKPLGPREITAEAFFARLSLEDVIAIMGNKDPRVVLAVVRLFVRSEVIDLDSDILKGLIAGLVDSGVPFDDADLARIFA